MEIVATEQTTTAILLNISNYVWFIACFYSVFKKTKQKKNTWQPKLYFCIRMSWKVIIAIYLGKLFSDMTWGKVRCFFDAHLGICMIIVQVFLPYLHKFFICTLEILLHSCKSAYLSQNVHKNNWMETWLMRIWMQSRVFLCVLIWL